MKGRTADLESGDYLRIKQAVLRSAPWTTHGLYHLLVTELAPHGIVPDQVFLDRNQNHLLAGAESKARFHARVPGTDKTGGFKIVSDLAHRMDGWLCGHRITETCRYDRTSYPGIYSEDFEERAAWTTVYFKAEFTLAFYGDCCGIVCEAPSPAVSVERFMRTLSLVQSIDGAAPVHDGLLGPGAQSKTSSL